MSKVLDTYLQMCDKIDDYFETDDGHTAEISFYVKNKSQAMKLARKHNQKSVWDWKKGVELPNEKYDPKKNPMKYRSYNMSKVVDTYLQILKDAASYIDTDEQKCDDLEDKAVEYREKNFTIEDWEELLKNAGIVQGKIFYKQKIESLKAKK